MGKFLKLIGLTAALLLAAGCRMQNIDELLQLPLQAEEHLQLQQEIEEILSGGAEYAAPTAGMNRQSVQYVDIDGDGTNEVLVFFRDDTAEKPLNIFIFQEVGDTFQVVETIREDGTAIHSIDYADLNGDGCLELIVGWSLSNTLQSLTAYDLRGFVATPLFSVNYTDYLTYDLSGDGLPELIALSYEGPDTDSGLTVYSYQDTEEAREYTVALSADIDTVVTLVRGDIQKNTPALVVESRLTSDNVVSDIIAWTENGPENITLSRGTSVKTERAVAAYASDVNGDGLLEVPRDVSLQGEGQFYVLRWYNYTLSGGARRAVTTYHNYADRWFLTIPDRWVEDLTVRRNDDVPGERAVIFSMLEDGGDVEDAEDFLIIYTLTGDNKEDRAALGDRFVLAETEGAIYAARIIRNLGDEALTEANITDSFAVIVDRWEE